MSGRAPLRLAERLWKTASSQSAINWACLPADDVSHAPTRRSLVPRRVDSLLRLHRHGLVRGKRIDGEKPRRMPGQTIEGNHPNPFTSRFGPGLRRPGSSSRNHENKRVARREAPSSRLPLGAFRQNQTPDSFGAAPEADSDLARRPLHAKSSSGIWKIAVT